MSYTYQLKIELCLKLLQTEYFILHILNNLFKLISGNIKMINITSNDEN